MRSPGGAGQHDGRDNGLENRYRGPSLWQVYGRYRPKADVHDRPISARSGQSDR